MKNLSLCVLIGGQSSEHDISLASGFSVLKNLNSKKYDIHTVIINKSGEWFLYSGSYNNIKLNTWMNDTVNLEKVCIINDGILLINQNKSIKIDVVFPVLHGKNGEDGTVQGLLTLSEIPFVGCSTYSSAVCMDKDFTNAILSHHGIKTINSLIFNKNSLIDYDQIKEKVESKFSYPIFIKPANAGSSVGISKVQNEKELSSALNLAFENDSKILVQEALIAQEIECAILGNNENNLVASTVGEIEPYNEFYDYEAKYSAPSNLYIPARIRPEIQEEVKKIAKKAFLTLNCSGFARVDFMITQKEEIILNEINTIPGFTDISMYPKLMEHIGISYTHLLDKLIDLAQNK